MFAPIPDQTERIATAVMDAAFKVHRALGPGLLESVYETCVCHELGKANVAFQRQVSIPSTYDGVCLDAGIRLDLPVDGLVIVELKAVESMNPLYEAQVLTYLRIANKRLGLLLNFNLLLLKDGFKRIVL